MVGMTSDFTWSSTLADLVAGTDLDEETCRAAMSRIMAGEATPAQIGGFAVALRAKGETATEVAGLVAAMLDAAEPLPIDRPALDIVGTGGDASHSVNISTLAAIVAGAAGATVVKHGNRAATSRCGSADVLEALGVRIDGSADDVVRTVEEVGIGFAFAPTFHPALRHAGPPRRELGIPTVFNILGPLANPAQPHASLIGAASERLAPVMAQVFVDQGRQVLVVHGSDGLDEITVAGDTEVWESVSGAVRRDRVSPSAVGWALRDAAELAGGDAQANAAVARALLAGDTSGPMRTIREAVVLNAAAALVAWDALDGGTQYGDQQLPLALRLRAAVPAAQDAIDSGRAEQLLARWVDVSNS